MAISDTPIPKLTADDVEHMSEMVSHIVTAVFGNPLDNEDHGLIGEMRETRKVVSDKLDRLYHSVLGLAGILVAVSTTLALALH